MIEHDVTSPRQALLDAFHITESDLAANRAGRLGAGQAARLTRSAVGNILAALLGAVVLGLILLGPAQKPLKATQWITCGVLAGALFAVAAVVNLRVRRSVSAGSIDMYVGEVTVVRRGRAGFFLKVAGQDFRLPVRPTRLYNGASYCVYVAPAARRIVAMELVDA